MPQEMLLMWVNREPSHVNEELLRQEFARYILIPYTSDRDRVNPNLDDLPDYLENIDDEYAGLTRDRGRRVGKYTSEVEDFLKDKGKDALTFLTYSDLKELLKKYYPDVASNNWEKLLKKLNLKQFPDNFKLSDVNTGEFQEVVGKLGEQKDLTLEEEEIDATTIDMDIVVKYPKVSIKFETNKAIIEHLVNNMGFDRGQIVSTVDEMRSLESGREEVHFELPDKKDRDWEISQIPKMDNFEIEQKVITVDILGKLLQQFHYMLSAKYSYKVDIEMEIRKIGEGAYEEETVDGEKQFVLDEGGDKIPIYENAENIITADLEIHATQTNKYSIRAGAFSSSTKYNQARDYYLKGVRGRLEEIDDAIKNIPKAGE